MHLSVLSNSPEPIFKSSYLSLYLSVHLEMRHMVDVGDAIGVGDIDGPPTRYELMCHYFTHNVLVK